MITFIRFGAILLALVLVGPGLSGCSGGSEESDTIRPGPVSDFRRQASVRTHAVDTGIAALEERLATADSVTGDAYQRTINELLETRRRFQEGLGSLDTLTVEQFDIVTDSLSTQLDLLERRVDSGVIELAPDLRSVKEAARERLAAIAEEIEELRVGSDSTLDAKLTELAQRGEAVLDSVQAASGNDFEVLRRTLVGDLWSLRTSLDSLRLEHVVRSTPSD